MPPLRIIAGKWKGRSIAAPPGLGTRPILDRAKTVLFDVLGHRLAEPGRLPPLAVLDLFGGSGALGLEALSRGAAYCLFIERNQGAAALLRRNLDSLQIIREAHVLEASAITVDFPPPPVAADTKGRYELVFMDPPYKMLSTRGPAGIPSQDRVEKPRGIERTSRRAGAMGEPAGEPQQTRAMRRTDRSKLRSSQGRRVGAGGSEAGQAESPDPSARGYPSSDIRRLLRRLAGDPIIGPSTLIVVRHDFESGGGPDLSPLVELDRRDAGSMTLRFLIRP